MAEFLKSEELATEDELAQVVKDVEREVNEAAEKAVNAPKPSPETATLYVYSPDVDPSSDAFETEAAARRQAGHDGRGHQPHDEGRDGA